MTPPSGPSDEHVVAYRLEKLEEQYVQLAHRVEEGFRSVRTDIRDEIRGLSLVRSDVYAADQKTQQIELSRVASISESSRAIAMWALGLVVSAIVGAIITLVVRLAA